MVDEKFIRDRITELRIKKNVSEYQMSLELGQSKGYVQGISSGRAMPSMTQFLNICDYFEIEPVQFFAPEFRYPQLARKAMDAIKELNEDDLMLIIALISRLK